MLQLSSTIKNVYLMGENNNNHYNSFCSVVATMLGRMLKWWQWRWLDSKRLHFVVGFWWFLHTGVLHRTALVFSKWQMSLEVHVPKDYMSNMQSLTIRETYEMNLLTC